MDERILECQDRAERAMNHFLRSLRHVPADRLDWSPTPTSKSALQIAAHCAGYSGGFVPILRTGAFPPVEEFMGAIQAATASVTTVAEAEEAIRRGTAETMEALASVRPEWIEFRIETPIGPSPFRFFMNIPAEHLIGHAYQIDYLQTCWDDQEIYFED